MTALRKLCGNQPKAPGPLACPSNPRTSPSVLTRRPPPAKPGTLGPTGIYTYYHLFEVSPTASAEVLAAAHKVLVKRYHPDGVRGAAEKTAREVKIKIVNTAWEVLGDPAKRREYDRAIGVR